MTANPLIKIIGDSTEGLARSLELYPLETFTAEEVRELASLCLPSVEALWQSWRRVVARLYSSGFRADQLADDARNLSQATAALTALLGRIQAAAGGAESLRRALSALTTLSAEADQAFALATGPRAAPDGRFLAEARAAYARGDYEDTRDIIARLRAALPDVAEGDG